MKKYRILLAALVIVSVSVFSYVGIASAHSFRTGNSVVIGSGQKVQDTLFAGGNSIDIAGEVFGDVFCAGQTITINGTVHGDVICAGQTVNITGKVDGDVRLAGQNVTVNGNITGNATIAGQSFNLSSAAVIGNDLSVGSADATLNGTIGRDLAAGSGTLLITNKIGRNIKGSVEHLKLSDTARVAGSIDYTSNNELEKSPGAVVGGKVTRTTPQKADQSQNAFWSFKLGWFIYWFFAMLVTAMALALLFPRILQNVTSQAIPSPWRALFAGFVASIVVPIILVALAITVIGLPIMLVLAMTWAVIAILSGPIFGYYLGRNILKSSRQPLLYMLVGASLLLVLYFIPIIGLFAFLFAYWAGSGMVVLELFHKTPRPAYTLADAPLTTVGKSKHIPLKERQD